MTLFERIKETAKKQGISITELSSNAGLGEKTIYKWKTQEPKVETLKKVAKELNVSVDYLLGNTDDPQPTSRRFVESGLSRADDKLNDITATGADMSDTELKKVLDYMGLIKDARKEN
ncbi:phage transcriptional regulator [Weissella oryzae SG25]|uniref:Phage transcriptional regulator n=1 Tax=Weissella oryzae (strain DSM 25784 / JCM 18191 / LMG 30913 / SG25) TaxID=1329250 RepID=A0A069CSF0_WEIOS|nr:helix-turn-helix domain-containing protein [Weissella oryzae]GAK30394.1 phage transcriptional regulator [Weissella oryzae SG25]